MTNVIFNNVVSLANKKLKKVTTYLEFNEDAWNCYHDFKMRNAFCMDSEEFTFRHNGATVSFDSDYLYRMFYDWCDCELSTFYDCCNYDGIDFKGLYDQVGRTNKFYIGKIHGEGLEGILEKCSDNYANSYIAITDGCIDVKQSIDNYDGCVDEFIEDLLIMIDSIYEDVTTYVDDIIKIYEYIKNLKENQCETFREYVQQGWLNML